MKTKHLICLAVLCGFSPALHAQTPPLTPSGPPSDPTTAMKSLNQVEPRTIIGSLPYTITQPGSYYLAGNLEFTAVTGDAITINASNVTVDMMGFTLSSTAVVTGGAIQLGSSASDVTIKNGTIKGNSTVTHTGAGIGNWTYNRAGFESGIMGGAGYSRFESLSIIGARGRAVYAGTGNTLHRLQVSQCCGNLISDAVVAPGGTLSECVVRLNSGGISADDATLVNCVASENGGNGFSVNNSTLQACRANNNLLNGIAGLINTLSNCGASNNGQIGFGCPDSSIVNCVAKNNGHYGFSFNYEGFNLGGPSVLAFSIAAGNGLQNLNGVPTSTGNNIAP